MNKIKRFLFIMSFLGCFSLNADWIKTYGGEGEDLGYCVIETKDGGYLITGCTRSFGAGWNNVWLIKTDAKGDTLWTRTYGGDYDDWGYCVIETRDGGYLMTGGTYESDIIPSDVWLIKTDSNGDTLWTRTYGGDYDDWGYCVIETRDGGYLMTGGTWSFGAESGDVLLIRIDPQLGIENEAETLKKQFYISIPIQRLGLQLSNMRCLFLVRFH